MKIGRGALWSVLAVAAVVSAAAAQDRPARRGWDGGGRGPGMASKRLAEFLGLSDDQRASWEAAHKDFRGTVEPLVQQMRTLRGDMEKALEASRPDPAAVGKLAIAMHDLHGQMQAAHKKLDDQLAGILTAEQRTKLEAFKAARGMGRGRGRGGPGFFFRGGADGPPPLPGGPDDDEN